MLRVIVLGLLVAACGGKTGNHRYSGPIAIELVNQTSRPIEQIFIFPMGTQERGSSWGALEPGAKTTVRLREGHFELVAVSARRRIDAKFTEVPEATAQLELREDLASTPRKLVFHDASETPMGVDQPGTLGVTFMLSAPEPAKPETPEGEAPVEEPAPQAP